MFLQPSSRSLRAVFGKEVKLEEALTEQFVTGIDHVQGRSAFGTPLACLFPC